MKQHSYKSNFLIVPYYKTKVLHLHILSKRNGIFVHHDLFSKRNLIQRGTHLFREIDN